MACNERLIKIAFAFTEIIKSEGRRAIYRKLKNKKVNLVAVSADFAAPLQRERYTTSS